MKTIPLILIFVTICIFPNEKLHAQKTLGTTDIVGIWQFGSSEIGDGINQNFVFFNTNFIFNNGKDNDDLVSTVQLKGRYRVTSNKLFFTIVSRLMIDHANIRIANTSIEEFGIFKYDDGVAKEFIEKALKEIEDPAVITYINPKHIKINGEDYYKVSSNPNDLKKFQ